MRKYEPAEMEIVYFDDKEMLLTTAMSYESTDNITPEIPDIDGEQGGIFG